jgi:hypothetical protein
MKTIKVLVSDTEKLTAAATRNEKWSVLNSHNSVVAENLSREDAERLASKLMADCSSLPKFQRDSAFRSDRGWGKGGFRVFFAKRDDQGRFLPVRIAVEEDSGMDWETESKWFASFEDALSFAQTL